VASLTGVGINMAILGELFKSNELVRRLIRGWEEHLLEIHISVDLANVVRKVLANIGELFAIYAYHTELVDLKITMRRNVLHPAAIIITLPSRRRSKSVKATTLIG